MGCLFNLGKQNLKAVSNLVLHIFYASFVQKKKTWHLALFCTFLQMHHIYCAFYKSQWPFFVTILTILFLFKAKAKGYFPFNSPHFYTS